MGPAPITVERLKGSKNLSNKRIHLGKKGENLAVNYLQKAGYTILIRNYRQKSGEIDIIAKDKTTLVFIEVKTRRTLSYGPPSASVTLKKQRQISKVAQDYLSRNNLFEMDARFDIVSIVTTTNQKPQIDLLQNAFELCYGF